MSRADSEPAMTLATDTRGLSVAVTHVLAIAITTVLVAGLLYSAGSLLDSERESSAEGSMEIIGERLAGEIASVDRYANSGDISGPGDPEVTVDSTDLTVTTSHQRTVSGSTYRISIGDSEDDECGALITDTDFCLVLSAQEEDVEVFVPMVNESVVTTDGSWVSGGSMDISYDSSEDEIVLAEADS